MKDLTKMELVDVYNENREKIGVKDRHSLGENEYLIGVRAIIINDENKILVTKRSKFKRLNPLKWECNGGAVSTGESSIEGIKRELSEEIGLKVDDKDIFFYKTIKRVDEFNDIFVIRTNKKIDEFEFIDEEVCDAKFITQKQFGDMVNNGEIAPVPFEPITKEMVEEVIFKIKLGEFKDFTDFLGRKWQFVDMGTAIIDGNLEVPGGIIYDGKYLVVNQDPSAPIPGFLIITLKRHVNSYSLLSSEERKEISEVLYKIENILKKLNISQNFTIVQEDRCPHFHIWVFPDKNWLNDKYPVGVEKIKEMIKLSKENTTEEIIKETLETVKKIKELVQ